MTYNRYSSCLEANLHVAQTSYPVLIIVFTRSACACGKWICTAEKCPEKHQQRNSVSLSSDSPVEDQREEDEDIDGEEYDEEEPEDDPDVQDVNWFWILTISTF